MSDHVFLLSAGELINRAVNFDFLYERLVCFLLNIKTLWFFKSMIQQGVDSGLKETDTKRETAQHCFHL